jgi:alpha-ketoglutarate-dependent taurine dioxygenase
MSIEQSASAPRVAGDVERHDRHLSIALGDELARFHYVWLRDNCWCVECRVVQSGERRLFTAYIPPDIAPADASVVDKRLRVDWNDGHASTYALDWLAAHAYSLSPRRDVPVVHWDATLDGVPSFPHDAVVSDDEVQAAYLDAVRTYGAAIVTGTPSVEREVERFAETVGHVRETAFERVHNVRHDPDGYNVAHTPLELKPHTDLPSYHWPPSIQLLHFLVNESTGGESTLVDGWAVLRDLRAADPQAFDTLCSVPVTFQLFSDDEDTRATAPIVQLDTAGNVRVLRFSNQLALPIQAPFEQVGEFYRAYQLLGSMLDSEKYKLVFKTHNGDLLTVHSHRVLHGRMAFDPASGARHLQDVYMEFDDLMARRSVLAGTHKPVPSHGGAE